MQKTFLRRLFRRRVLQDLLRQHGIEITSDLYNLALPIPLCQPYILVIVSFPRLPHRLPRGLDAGPPTPVLFSLRIYDDPRDGEPNGRTKSGAETAEARLGVGLQRVSSARQGVGGAGDGPRHVWGDMAEEERAGRGGKGRERSEDAEDVRFGEREGGHGVGCRSLLI